MSIAPIVLEAIAEPTPKGISAGIGRLIAGGELPAGERLPTVRDLASALGVSPATVSAAWQTLAAAGLIVSRGRNGSVVREGTTTAWLPGRYRALSSTPAAALDLARGTPDPSQLPALAPALRAIADEPASLDPTNYAQRPDTPDLHDLLAITWPAPVETLTITNGAMDAIDRALDAITRFGDRVAVENPTFPPLIDLLERRGLEVVPVALDAQGMRPVSLARTLGTGPAAVILQPRAQNPTGASLTALRARALADVIESVPEARRTYVIEDDHSGEISSVPAISLGKYLPDRVLHVRSFAKSHGPELRTGALGGPREIIDAVVARRLLGPGWTSRMTQSILHFLLTDPVATAQVASARDTYRDRQVAFRRAMSDHGVELPPADGLNAWIPVANEDEALAHLGAKGLRVAPGSPFRIGDGAHVRVTVGMIDGDPHPVAEALAEVALPGAQR